MIFGRAQRLVVERLVPGARKITGDLLRKRAAADHLFSFVNEREQPATESLTCSQHSP
jgi:hypothetical protein